MGERSGRYSPIAPLFVWLLIQMAVLVLAAQRVPLWARFPDDAERLAVHEMLVAQVAAGALLFPWLLRDRMTALLVIGAAMTFAQLAAFLGGVSHARAAIGSAYVAGWLLGLAMWRPLLVRWRATMIGVAVAASLAMGGALIAYLRAEASTEPFAAVHFGPILGALAQLDTPALGSWAFLIAFLATSLIALLSARRSPSALP